MTLTKRFALHLGDISALACRMVPAKTRTLPENPYIFQRSFANLWECWSCTAYQTNIFQSVHAHAIVNLS